MGLFDKPPAGTPVNGAHALAPRSATAALFAFLDSGATTVVDDFHGLTFTRVGTDSGPIWTAAGFPGASGGVSLDLKCVNSSPVSCYKYTGGPTGVPAFVTLAAIVKLRSTPIDGPRVVGNGVGGGAVLEPSFTTNAKVFVLNGGVAHVNTNVAMATGDYYFVGVCVRSGQYIDVYVYNYTTATGATIRATYTTGWSSSDGAMFLGGPSTSYTNGTDGLLYWAMIDHAEWTVADLTSLAASPFAMYSAALTAGTVTTSNLTSSSIDVASTAATNGTAPYTYKLQIAPNVSGSPGTWSDVGTYQSGRTWTAGGLAASTTYWFRVVARDSAGSPATANSTAVSAATTASAPAASPPPARWFPGISAARRMRS